MNFELIELSLCFALLSLAVWTNISYAQLLQPGAGQDLLPPTVSPGKRVLPNTDLSPLSPKLHAVRITSPTKGQQVPIDKDLIITGISLTNSTSHCQVSVIANGVKPYQAATGTGPGGAADYSKWNFVLNSKYTIIKQGPDNKITAKYTCSNNPSAASFYSVNVTGVAVASATPTSTASPAPP